MILTSSEVEVQRVLPSYEFERTKLVLPPLHKSVAKYKAYRNAEIQAGTYKKGHILNIGPQEELRIIYNSVGDFKVEPDQPIRGYNPSGPFYFNGKIYTAVRLQPDR